MDKNSIHKNREKLNKAINLFVVSLKKHWGKKFIDKVDSFVAIEFFKKQCDDLKIALSPSHQEAIKACQNIKNIRSKIPMNKTKIRI